MTDPRALLDAYAQGYELVANGRLAGQVQRDVIAPKAFAALRAALDAHPPSDGLAGTGVRFCLTCWVPGREAMEPARWPCPTAQAITTALEAK
ncbi:MAG TPA: hypothetical protein VHX38_23945 [Pseudonocardiaceae bacterium]|jgi:hypothetical protein|nr:hypothetical protein [Pseudonocardiaceae bacterium]